MKVLKITLGAWHNESRDKKELSVAREAGAEVFVMAKGNKGDNFKKDYVDGFLVYRFSTRPLGNQNYLNHINRVISFFIWVFKAREFNADVISGHDLIALFIAWLSNIGRKNKAKLVYDSHEFEIGRNVKRTKLTLFVIKKLEKFLIKKSMFSIMVNESIADMVMQVHKLNERPVVVRNIPNYWYLDDEIIMKIRSEICSKFNISLDSFIVMYHGGINNGRGIEKLLEAIKLNGLAYCVVLGNGEISYLDKLKDIVATYNIENRVLFMNAVPIEVLWQYVGAADVGVTLAQNTCLNHFYMLPNKLFENIQSLTPVIGSKFPEIEKIIDGYKIGVCVEPDNAHEINNAIQMMMTNKEFYKELQNSLIKAKSELCWENEKKILLKAYSTILHK